MKHLYVFICFKKMDKRIERIGRSYTKFLNAVDTKTIPTHYDISDDFQIIVTKTADDTFLIDISYENKPPLISQLQLPSDIHNYIKSFLYKKNHMNSTLFYPEHYPFRPPKWSIDNTSLTLKNELHVYNRSLEESWLPCLNFENEVLCYLVWAIQLF